MICKKCGQHYEDDMLKCLWCDALNENYVAPEKEEIPSVADIVNIPAHIDTFLESHLDPDERAEETSEKHPTAVTKHPAGEFMWCAFILGFGYLSYYIAPLFIAFFHREELMKRAKTKRFVSIGISANTALILATNKIAELITKTAVDISISEETVAIIDEISGYIADLACPILIGYASAFLLRRMTPGYDANEYKSNSRSAVFYSIPFMIATTIIIDKLIK